MFKLKWKDWQFSLVTFVAAMLALFISMSIDLQRPYWSMMTVYIVSQPMAAAVRSKAVYRLLGTLLGAAMALFLVPLLIDAPVLLCLALAAWVGGCLAISMLDRSPRSYVMMLAGYTAAIVGFSSVNQPTAIFDLVIARSEEIVIGIVCASVLHSLWFPKPFGLVLRGRLGDMLRNADQWALDILNNNDASALRGDRHELAVAATEIHIMATHLPFDISHFRETSATVRALHDQLLLLIPTLSSVSERLTAMRAARPELDLQTLQLIARTAAWIESGARGEDADALIAELTDYGSRNTNRDWYALNRTGLLSCLAELVQQLAQGHELIGHLHDPEVLPGRRLAEIIAQSGARPLHSDVGMASLAGITASVAILVSCFVWINTGWTEGGASAMLAAILSCLFAAMDDPTPAMKKFGYSQLIAVPLAGLYIFVIFPQINSFPILALSLAPTMLVIGALIARPNSALLALITLLNMCNAMALQESTNTDFSSFANNNLSMFFGIFTAIFVTRSFRSVSAEANARRLLRLTWKGLARLVQTAGLEDPKNFASHMVDRIGVLTPLLSASRNIELSGLEPFNELRTGMNLVALQAECVSLPEVQRRLIEDVLRLVGLHYQARSAARRNDDQPLLHAIDLSLANCSAAGVTGRAALTAALVGLRANLFPDIGYMNSSEYRSA